MTVLTISHHTMHISLSIIKWVNGKCYLRFCVFKILFPFPEGDNMFVRLVNSNQMFSAILKHNLYIIEVGFGFNWKENHVPVFYGFYNVRKVNKSTSTENARQHKALSKSPIPSTCSVSRVQESHIRTWGWKKKKKTFIKKNFKIKKF